MAEEELTEEERELRRLRAASGSVYDDWPKGKVRPLPKHILDKIKELNNGTRTKIKICLDNIS